MICQQAIELTWYIVDDCPTFYRDIYQNIENNNFTWNSLCHQLTYEKFLFQESSGERRDILAEIHFIWSSVISAEAAPLLFIRVNGWNFHLNCVCTSSFACLFARNKTIEFFFSQWHKRNDVIQQNRLFSSPLIKEREELAEPADTFPLERPEGPSRSEVCLQKVNVTRIRLQKSSTRWSLKETKRLSSLDPGGSGSSSRTLVSIGSRSEKVRPAGL